MAISNFDQPGIGISLEPWEEGTAIGTDDIAITRHGTALKDIRWRLKTPIGAISVSTHSLPLATSSVTAISCVGVLECTRDDEALAAELGRVVHTGGHLQIEVPAAGMLSWLDHMNAYRYLRDISRRGERLPGLAESGWRRHYSAEELARLLESHGFEFEKCRRRGAAMAEPIYFVGEFLFRWLWPRSDMRASWYRWARAVELLDRRLGVGRHGARLQVTARRQ
jgi:SAM-dependent methyltransferase